MRAWLFIWSCVLVVCAFACGGGGGNNNNNGDDGGTGGDGSDPFNNGKNMIQSITVEPPVAQLTLVNDMIMTQQFKCVAHLADNTTKDLLTDVMWFATNPQIGKVDGGGTYTPTADIGGVVQIRAEYMGMKATAQLTVKLTYQRNSAMLGMNEQNALRNASTPDGSIVWAYPYNKTVFPRGLASAPLEWFNGQAMDVYRIHVGSPTYDLEDFVKVPPPSRYVWANADWVKFVDSTSGAAKMDVERWNGMTATVVVAHNWTIAPASMRGTVYYWANNTGRIMRIKGNATTPDDFSNGIVPNGSCTMTCHTVSADGSTMVAAGGTYGGSYDLKNNKPLYGLGGSADSAQIRQWGLPAVSPDGKYVLLNALMNQLTGYSGNGLFQTANGMPAPNSGVPNERMYMPAFSPDGKSIAFVSGTNPNTGYWLAIGMAGNLKTMDYNPMGNPMLSNERTVVLAGNDTSKNLIVWPTIAPDGKWAVYGRQGWTDPSTNQNLSSYDPIQSDLYIAELSSGTEARLAQLDGDGYPFAAGTRDLHRNFEPSFAPVAAGGYFWVVFHSRRTYGNELTGAYSAVKQLWIAAIDQNPQPGQDPSHPPFRVPGQDLNTLNLRGYFALDPCKGDGQGCTSGTECCGGYCNMAPMDGGGPVCAPTSNGCANNGDKCNVDSDCCGVANGVTCINHVCSEPTPK